MDPVWRAERNSHKVGRLRAILRSMVEDQLPDPTTSVKRVFSKVSI